MFAGSIEEYGEACRAKGRAEALRKMIVKQLLRRFNEVPEYLVVRLGAIAAIGRLERLFDDTYRVDSLEEFDALLV